LRRTGKTHQEGFAMRNFSRIALAAAAAASLAATSAVGSAIAGSAPMAAGSVAAAPGSSQTGVALTANGSFLRFDAARLSDARGLGQVQGLNGDRRLVGIDYRVQDGRLYGVGNAGGVYTIRPRMGDVRATKVSQLTVPLDGSQFGVDFNPAANRLRVISNTGQNLRHNIDDATAPLTTTVDGVLTYPATPTTPAITATGATAAAYTNNDLDPNTATTLFDIDTMLDQVVIQSPANAGLVQPTGKLGMDVGPVAGFDISTATSARGTTNKAFAVLQSSGRSRLADIRLLSGEANWLGNFGPGRTVVDVAMTLP
jgi:Domain of unknown function (DUF4394)